MSENKQVKEFEAEVSQLLKLMIHSVYSNKEIFLRELISNASDAIDRLRFDALEDETLFEGDTDLKIRVDYDADAHTVTVRDNGIGMSREEVSENIGTIARSGTREFIERLSASDSDGSQLIGQFGVGFYSAFMVADKVELRTRRAGEDASEGVLWQSSGDGTYSIEPIEKADRGTEIVIYLTDEDAELADGSRLRHIAQKYSDHISFPIEMPVEQMPGQDEEGEEEEKDSTEGKQFETVNQASALWVRPRSEIDDEEYKEFYKHVAHDFEDPLTWTHSKVEGRLKFNMLFYVPGRRPFDMNTNYEGQRHGIKLYVRRVFIMDDAEMFMPRYLRFVRGVVDSDDLDLNVSREFLQENRVVAAMRKTAVKRVLDMLEELGEDDEKFTKFWDAFGPVLKEGIVEDAKNRDRIAALLRFASTHDDQQAQTHTLADYVERMQDGQDTIYYVTAESFAAAKNSPHLEIFRDKGVEVLLLHDRVDEWVVSELDEFDGHKLQSVAMGELDLDFDKDSEGDDADADEDSEEAAEVPEELEGLLEKMREALGQRVQDVRVSKRLTTSPACLVAGRGGVSANLDRILKQAGELSPGFAPVLELNADHPIIQKLGGEVDNESFSDWTQVLYDQAILSEGGRPEDPATFVKRMNKLMVDLMG
ncbi:MAG: molecular chaperone HtpG [Persicimonas sp.]